MRKYRLLFWFLLLVGGALSLGGGHASALGNNGPDDTEYGGANTDYTLSNTSDVTNAIDMALPVYSKQKPFGSGLKLHIHIDSGDGCIQFGLSPMNGSSTQRCYGLHSTAWYAPAKPYTSSNDFDLYVPVPNFGSEPDARTGFWTATMYVHLPGAINHSPHFEPGAGDYVNFNASLITNPPTNPRYIGYSANNSPRFAIANRNRCDSDGDPGCYKSFHYKIPFAGSCDQPSNENTYIILYDDDNPKGTSKYDIQPTGPGFPGKFVVTLWDTTFPTPTKVTSLSLPLASGGPGGTSPRGTGSNQFDVRRFSYLQGHKYELRLDSVYSNNVIQFKLPFDSIYSLVQCQWGVHGTTNFYPTKVKSIGGVLRRVCDNTAPKLASGAILGAGTTFCAENYVTADDDNTQQTTYRYGVRYTTYNPAATPPAWNAPLNPPSGPGPPIGSRPSSGAEGVGGACVMPNHYWGAVERLSTDPVFDTGKCRTGINYGDPPSTGVHRNAGEDSEPALPDTSTAATGSNPTGYTSGGRYNQITIPAGTPDGTVFCEWVAFDPVSASVSFVTHATTYQRNGYSQRVCIKVGASPTAGQCNLDGVPPPVSLGSGGLSFVPQVDTVSAVPPNGSFTAIGAIDPLGNPVVVSPNAPVGAAVVSTSGPHKIMGATATINVLTTLVPGEYTLTWTWTNGTDTVSCAPKVKVGYTPYFSVKGGDASAGAGVGDSGCTPNNTATIKSWSQSEYTLGDYAGAGSQLGALALGDIKYFATNLVGGPGNAAEASALSFADSPLTAGTLGGKFGSLPCVKDYYADSAAAVKPGPGGSVGSMTLSDFTAYPSDNIEHTYNVGSGPTGGDLRINATTLNEKQLLTFRVNGNVYIDGTINYAYSALDKVPRLSIFASGSIFIDHSVQSIHGLYVVQKNTDLTLPYNGIFATCYDKAAPGGYNNHVAPDPETTVASTCNQPLTVYGAVLTDTLHLDRSYGNLYPYNGTPVAPAETFQYTPELWLSGWRDCHLTGFGGGCGQFKSLNGLPPVL